MIFLCESALRSIWLIVNPGPTVKEPQIWLRLMIVAVVVVVAQLAEQLLRYNLRCKQLFTIPEILGSNPVHGKIL